jgi:cytochrome c oxidase subunit II
MRRTVVIPLAVAVVLAGAWWASAPATAQTGPTEPARPATGTPDSPPPPMGPGSAGAPADPNSEATPPLTPSPDQPSQPTAQPPPQPADQPADAGTIEEPTGAEIPPPAMTYVGKGVCPSPGLEDVKGLPAWVNAINKMCWDTGGNFWMPTPAAREARSDYMFYVVLGLSAFFFVGITVVTIVLVIKYRARPGHRAQPSRAHDDVLEITWTVIPTIITVFLFIGGWNAYVDMNTRPAEPITIKVVAKQWSWDFEYPNGVRLQDLHVPVDRDVELQMTSVDVLHSFFVPNFRVKSDIVPRRYTYVYFRPTETGVYRLYCTEYCGRDHSLMKNKAYVHEYNTWERYLGEIQKATQNLEPKDLGKLVYESKGCKTCHSTDGSRLVGPSWKGIWGEPVPLADGSTTTVDAAFVKTAIEDPNKEIRAGYAAAMPTYAGQLSEAEINGVAAYIESLK